VRALEAAQTPGQPAAALARARADYRASEGGVVRQCAWLGQNIRFVLVGAPGVLGWPAAFLWLTALPLNAVLVALVATHERRAGRVLAALSAAAQAPAAPAVPYTRVPAASTLADELRAH
jgi:hypothetical protein